MVGLVLGPVVLEVVLGSVVGPVVLVLVVGTLVLGPIVVDVLTVGSEVGPKKNRVNDNKTAYYHQSMYHM